MEETKKQLEKLKQALAETERSDQAKSNYMAQVTHNIRIPMNTITGMTEIARMNIDDKEKVAECLDKIDISGQRLVAIINEITDMSELQNRVLELDETPFFLGEMMVQIFSGFAVQIQNKGHHVRIIAKDVVHEQWIADKGRIQQILSNLISNALSYTLPGGNITITVSELHSFQNSYSLFRFEIEDDGIGMSEEFMKDMYQPFARAEDPRISKEQGTGLGLTIALRIVRMMSGDMTVVSEPGVGTKATVTLHIKRQAEQELAERYLSTSLLVVNDQQDEGIEILETLRNSGIAADCISSPARCIEKIQNALMDECPYRCIIIKWKMAEMSGMDLANAIAEQMGTELPGIIFVSNEWDNIYEMEKASAFSDFITRPVTLPKIFFAMNRICPQVIAEKVQNRKISSLAGKRMLVAEDNELNAEMIKELLQQNGVVVEVAENGVRVLDMLAAKEKDYFDCILMDVQMPVMNGYEATKRIRESERIDLQKIPILAMTADAFSEDIKKAKEAGMNAHVAKPFDIIELMEVFMQIFNKI